MAIYALGDLHLSFTVKKPMDVFGPAWDHHAERIEDAWRETVTADDIVLVPGDISWAMTLAEALPDLDFIGRLPGRKVMIKGNHDYWWGGIGKVRQVLRPGHFAIQNDAVLLSEFAICGTRGWVLPSHPKYTDQDHVIYERELLRLRMSLQQAAKYDAPILAMLHYPPCSTPGESTPYTDLLSEFGVCQCVYGHLHGASHRYAFEGVRDGVQYRLVSADFVDFKPVLLHV